MTTTWPLAHDEPQLASERRRRGHHLALVTACVSGLAVFVNGYGVRRFPDATLYTTAKNLAAGMALAGLALARHRWARVPAPTPRVAARAWVGLAVVAVVGGSVPFVLFFEGLARASSTDAALIHKTLVLWVALLAVPLLRERLGPLQVGAIGLVLAGQVVLGGGLPSLVSGPGEAMILAATLLWAVETVVAKHLLASIPPAVVGLARMGLGSLALVGWTVATGKLPLVTDVDARGWVLVGASGLLLAAYVACWFAALARAPAVDVTALLVVGAVVTSLLDAVVEGAPLAPDAGGLGLILAGGALLLAPRRHLVPVRAKR